MVAWKFGVFQVAPLPLRGWLQEGSCCIDDPHCLVGSLRVTNKTLVPIYAEVGASPFAITAPVRGLRPLDDNPLAPMSTAIDQLIDGVALQELPSPQSPPLLGPCCSGVIAAGGDHIDRDQWRWLGRVWPATSVTIGELSLE